VASPHEVKKQAGNFIAIMPASYEALANHRLVDDEVCANALENYLGISMPQPVVGRGVISDYSGGYAGSQGGIYTSGPTSTFDTFLDNLPDSWRYALNGQCVNAHEMTHLFLGDVPMPTWLNEGLATITQTTARTNYYNNLDIECRESGWYGRDYFGTVQEVPYQNLMVYDSSVPGIYYYYTGMCFWDAVESTYGSQAVQQIIQATVAYRSPVYNGCTPETLSTYFIQDIVNPVLGVDISSMTQAKFGFGPTYTGCEFADEIPQSLQIDSPAVCEEIETLIRTTQGKLKRDGAVVAVSGGLDSAVAATLAVRTLGQEKIHLLNLPERDSQPLHRKHAKQLADGLGVNLQVKSITPILKAAGTYKLLPLRFLPGRKLRTWLVAYGKSKLLEDQGHEILADRFHPGGNTFASRAVAYVFAKHRVRMVLIYQHAEVHNLMVIGAANRTEWLTGTFSQWGVDHCADLMPLIHLYRSQLEQVAEYLQVPEFIRRKPADPDFLPGIDDKGAMLGSFALTDQILCGLENRVPVETLYDAYGKTNVDKIIQLTDLSTHMREVPYKIDPAF
jgi:NAD+ synthase